MIAALLLEKLDKIRVAIRAEFKAKDANIPAEHTAIRELALLV